MNWDKFLSRPKLLKESKWVAVWPFIFDASGGMSFSPIRLQGCLHYIALAIFWIVFIGIIVMPVSLAMWLYEALTGTKLPSGIETTIIVWWLILMCVIVWVFRQDEKRKQDEETPKAAHPAYSRVGRKRRAHRL